jgi:hypothetical protein
VEELLQLVRQLVGLHRAELVEDGLVAGEVGVLGEELREVRVLDPVHLEREEDERRGEGGDAVLRVGDELGALGVGGVLVVAQARVGHEAARDGVDLLVAEDAVEEVGGGEGGELALVVGGEAGAGVLEPVHVALELGRVGGGVEVGEVPVGEGAEVLGPGGVRVEDGGFHGPCSLRFGPDLCGPARRGKGRGSGERHVDLGAEAVFGRRVGVVDVDLPGGHAGGKAVGGAMGRHGGVAFGEGGVRADVSEVEHLSARRVACVNSPEAARRSASSTRTPARKVMPSGA